MSKGAKLQEAPRRSFTPDIVGDSPGAFRDGHRVTTPAGNFFPKSRPVSQLTTRLRGLCNGCIEDDRRCMSPEAVSRGSIQEYRTISSSRGRYVILPPEWTTRPIAVRLQKLSAKPDLKALSTYIREVKLLTKTHGQMGVAITNKTSHPNALEELFDEESKVLALTWQKKVLRDDRSLLYQPSSIAAIENVTEQSQLARTSTLLAALLSLRKNIQSNNFIPLVRDKELMNLAPFTRMFGFCRVRSKTGDQMHYYEESRHVMVGFKSFFYELEVIEPEGRYLTSSEIHEKLKLIVQSAVSPICSMPFGHLSLLPREEFLRLVEDISSQCESNKRCFELLNSALLFVAVSLDGSITLDTPQLPVTPPEEAKWVGTSLQLAVFPNGNATLSSSSLTIDSSLLNAAAAFTANSANCDPMLEYHAPEACQIQAVSKMRRTPTPTAGGKKPAKSAPTISDELLVAPVTLTVPPPPVAADPRALPLWMPRAYCEAFTTSEIPPSFAMKGFDLSLKNEYSLHLGAIFALAALQPDQFPLVHVSNFHAIRDPAIHLCLTNEVESAVRHMQSFTQMFGPLRTEVDHYCRAALRSLENLIQRTPPHYSDFHTLLQHAVADPKKHENDVNLGAPFGPPQLVITKQQTDPGLLWGLQTPTHTHPDQVEFQRTPYLQYSCTAGHRSSLQGKLGCLYSCHIVFPSGDEEFVERIARGITLFSKFVDDSVAHIQKRKLLAPIRY